MTNHQEALLLSAYLDGELSGREKQDFSLHLRDCAACRSELKSLEEIKLQLKGASRRAMPPDLIVSIEKRLEVSRRAQAPRKPAVPLIETFRRTALQQLLIPAAVAALVSLIVGLWFVRMRRGPDQYAPLNPVMSAQAKYPGRAAARPRSPVASNNSAP